MPRIDGYPSADPLTGNEVLPGMQGGATKSITLALLGAHLQSLFEPLITERVNAAIAASGIGGGANQAAVLGRAVLGRMVLGLQG